MGTLSMKVLVVLVSVVACAAAQNVVCGKGSSTNKEVTVEDKKTYTFKTQKGKKYPGNTECTVKYKMGDTCAKMSFVCNKFNTNNKDKSGSGAICKVKCTEAAGSGTGATTWSPSNCRCGEKLSRAFLHEDVWVIGGGEAPVNGYP